MDFVTPIITPIVESLLVPIKRHMSFLVSSATYVRDMHAKVRELNRAAGVLDAKRKANNANGLAIPENVREWLTEVEKIKVIDNNIQTGGVGCFNIKMRYKVAKKSYDILKDVDSLMKEKADMVWTDELIPIAMVSPPRPITSTKVIESNHNQCINIIKSRELIFNVALKSLEPTNDTNKKMALCGMGGVGKTTMMEQLKDAAKNMKMYDSIVKVNVGQNPNPIDVQNVVAEYTGRALTETTKDIRAERLQKRFREMSEEGKKKILVILDDVWEEFNLKDIGLTNPLPDGFKLLMTSREETVCTQMGVEASSIFRIDVLEESEAKTLFWEIARPVSSSVIDYEVHHIGEEIVKRCGCLPLAIQIIASTLRDNSEKYAWEDALFRLQNREFNAHNIFEISYNNLKEDDKAVFLLSGLFPEDCYIFIEDLMRYVWGLNIFKTVDTIAQARCRVNTCVNKLIRSNLLIKSDEEGYVKMHDLVRDFVLSNFSEVKQASIVNSRNNVSKKLKEDVSYERILLQCGDMFEFPLDVNHSNLTFFMLMGEMHHTKFPEDFFVKMKTVQVLAFENICHTLIPKYLTNLRVLSLRLSSGVNENLFLLGDLINLEVLTLVKCWITKLPSEIGKLKKLKLLEFCGFFKLSISDGVFKNLNKLEELYMSADQTWADKSYIMFTDASCEELYMLSKRLSALEIEFFENNVHSKYVSFEKLERFRISIGCKLPKRLYCNGDSRSFKNTLKVVTNKTELLESKINELFWKTEILYLEVKDMDHLEDFLTHSPQRSFGNLKKLTVSNCGGLTYLFTIPVAKGLTKLQMLEIKSCPVMKSVVYVKNGEAGAIRFDKLERLSLKDLPELVSLCNVVNIIELPQLVELDLDELHNIISIFPDNNINISGEQPFLNKVEIPKLTKLNVHSMKSLKEIWPCEEKADGVEQDMLMLREIQVHNCDSLVNIFPSNPMRLISHLVYICVKECGSIEALFNIDMLKIEQLNGNSSLTHISVTNLKNLREICRVKDAVNNYHGFLICGFEAVKLIYIEGCERFRNIVTPCTANFDMRALTGITIRSCGDYYNTKYKLVKDSQEQEIFNVPDKEISELGYKVSSVVFPSSLIIDKFCRIELQHFQGVEVLFEIERNIDQSVTTKQPLKPDHLHLKLDNMDNMTHVWKCSNWNEFFTIHKNQPECSFQNLNFIYLSNCKSIKYLFSPLMVKLLSKLRHIKIETCDGLEEVVSNQDDEYEEITNTTTTYFPHLAILELRYLDKLKHIGGGGAAAKGTTSESHGQTQFYQGDVGSWSLSQYAELVDIHGCHALSCVIPSYAAGRHQKLHLLRIKDCSSMKEVFEIKEINNINSSGCNANNSDPASDTKVAIPRPRNSTIHKLPNLKVVTIDNCESLEYIFTPSTLESLKTLEVLTITNCKALKVIVREEDEERTSTSCFKDVFLPQLKVIELGWLQNLEGFFLGTNIDFHLQLFDDVAIYTCPQMVAFTYSKWTAPRLKYMRTELGKHNVESGLSFHGTPMLHQTPSSSPDTISKWRTWVFHSLVECNYDQRDSDTMIFPYSELQQLQNLETVHAEDCSKVENVFEVALELTNNESQTVVKFPKLREVHLERLSSLKYIWKNNQWRKLEFPNLTRLSIDGCKSLEYVFTCSMVGYVMQLQELHIEGCENMKVVVKGEEKEEECDEKVSEIIEFPCLKSLELDDLKSLEGFCLGKENFTFPSLDTMEISDCPKISVFTRGCSNTPKLTEVETNFESFNVEGDINSFIITKKHEEPESD